jgi:hypothetical protein
MANKFSVVPQTVVVGTPTNNVAITFYYDFVDHSICKMTVTPTGTLAAATMVPFNRNGLAVTGGQTTSIPAQDTALAIPLELNSGDVCDSVVPHNAGFGV